MESDIDAIDDTDDDPDVELSEDDDDDDDDDYDDPGMDEDDLLSEDGGKNAVFELFNDIPIDLIVIKT